MSYSNIALNPLIQEKLRNVSKSEFKTIEEVILESITRYANDVLSVKKHKKQLALEFLEGKIGFDDFARIVGYDNAKELLDAKKIMEESIENAKKEFSKSGD